MASYSNNEDDESAVEDVIMKSLRELCVHDFVTFCTLKDSSVCIGTFSEVVDKFENVSSIMIKLRSKANKEKSRKYSPCEFRSISLHSVCSEGIRTFTDLHPKMFIKTTAAFGSSVR